VSIDRNAQAVQFVQEEPSIVPAFPSLSTTAFPINSALHQIRSRRPDVTPDGFSYDCRLDIAPVLARGT
jgi:hypothetical protein